MGFFDKPIKLENLKIITYIDYLNRLVSIIIPPEPLQFNTKYYFYSETSRLPDELNKRFIEVELINVFPSSESDLGNPWYPATGGNVTNYTCIYYFRITKVRDTENEILENSSLHGFRAVIDDNKYFDKIPQINELWHFDNGVISHMKVTVDSDYPNNISGWDDIHINHNTEISENTAIIKMLKEGHEHPNR